MSFVSFLQEKKSFPSFLFRRKEAKENQLRSSFPSVLLPFSSTCYTKRAVHIRTVRFLFPCRTCGKVSFLRLIIYPAVSFVSFLQEKKSFPLRRKEAKENRLRLSFFSALLPLSPTCSTKRTVHIRTVRFFVPCRTRGKASYLRKTSSPAVSFVSFLQEKKSFPFFSF